MSYLQRKTNYAYSIQCFLKKQGFDISGKGNKSNKVMVKFLKEHNLPYHKWNRNYRGFNTAELLNAETIQDNWKEFKKWILNNILTLKQNKMKNQEIATVTPDGEIIAPCDGQDGSSIWED